MPCDKEEWASDDGLCGPTCTGLRKLCRDVKDGECPTEFSVGVVINVEVVKRWIEMLEENYKLEGFSNTLQILNELKEELRGAEVLFEEEFDEFGHRKPYKV